MADNQPVPMPPHIKAELARLRALMIPDAEAYRRREIGSKRMEEEAKKIQPLRPLSAADTDVQYPLAAKGGRIQHKWHGGPIVDSLVGTFPSLAPVANAIGATKIGLSEKELPTDDMYWYSNGATRDLIGNDRRGDVNPMLGVPLSTQPTDLPKSIKMYRADPTGKYGGKEGLETLPQPRFDVGGDRYHKKVEDPTVSDVYGDSSKAIQQLYRYARLNGAANKYGYPSLSPEDVAAMALKEGRSDLGFNAVNLGHPDELKFNKMLRDTYNLTSNDQNFLAALFAKQRVADKFKIPFANAWNGTGVNDAGQSGKDYAKNYEHHKKAALHPNNQQLMELINRAIEDGKKHGLPLRENSIKDSMRHYIPVPYKAKGGVIDMDRMRLELMGKAKGGRSSPFKKSKAQYVVYHGTNRNFNTFDPNAKSNTQGGEKLRGTGAHFFTPNKELANAYTGASKSETTGKYHAWPPESIHGGNVMPVYLNMVNPLDIDAEGKMYHQVEHHVKDAKRKGHDSVILRNVVDQPGAAGSLQTHKHDAHIVFNPNQIKSAIGNRGTYDINDPDITKAKGGSVMGVNVASDRKHNLNYADLIVDGHKTIESRNSDTLRPYVGKRVAIVRTGSGKAKAIGEVTIGEPIVANKKQFRNMESHHLVPEGSTFDIKTPTKHMYPLSEPVRYDEERDVGHGIISRKVIHKDKGGKIEVRPTVFDDAASRRNPKIEAAARALMEGEMKQKAYAKLVAKEKPVKPYEFIPKPATDEDAMRALHEPKKPKWRGHESWPAGHRVGLRLDIPAYEDHGVWVNSIHDESGAKGDDMLKTAYGPVSAVRNAEFQGTPHKAIQVATGEKNKAPFAKIMGELEHMTEEQAVKHMKKYLKHPDYRQIGYDPRRHGDFYDRETMEPVTHSEHVVQIGPLVLAKKPKYGKREVYAKGGATHAHHLDIEERPL